MQALCNDWKALRKIWEEEMQQACAIKQPIEIPWTDFLVEFEQFCHDGYKMVQAGWEEFKDNPDAWLAYAYDQMGLTITTAKAIYWMSQR